MTALGKLFRTTTFKLTLVYLTVFALFAAFLLAYFAWNTRRLVTQQIVATVDAEIAGLSDLYQQGGIRRLIFAIDDRGSRPGLEPLSPHHRGRRGRHRQYRLADHRHPRQVRLDRDRLSPHRRQRHRSRAPGAGARAAASGRIPPAGRPRSPGARAAARHHHQRRPLVDRDRGRARHRRRLLRHAPRAQARRRHDRHHPADHERRPVGAAADRGQQ